MRDKISSWVRQARHRAKRYKCISRLDLHSILILIDDYNGLCAYCAAEAYIMGHAFPLADRAPNVLANCLPICKACKEIKKNKDLVAYRQDGKICEDKYLELIKAMLTRDGADELRTHIRTITGIGF